MIPITYANLETRTDSRSVQADTPFGVIVIGATRHSDPRNPGHMAPWPTATVVLPPNAMLTLAQWDVITRIVEDLFREYAQKYEGVILEEAHPARLERTERESRSRTGPRRDSKDVEVDENVISKNAISAKHELINSDTQDKDNDK
jgi:hypothetical protein